MQFNNRSYAPICQRCTHAVVELLLQNAELVPADDRSALNADMQTRRCMRLPAFNAQAAGQLRLSGEEVLPGGVRPPGAGGPAHGGAAGAAGQLVTQRHQLQAPRRGEPLANMVLDTLHLCNHLRVCNCLMIASRQLVEKPTGSLSSE